MVIIIIAILVILVIIMRIVLSMIVIYSSNSNNTINNYKMVEISFWEPPLLPPPASRTSIRHRKSGIPRPAFSCLTSLPSLLGKRTVGPKSPHLHSGSSSLSIKAS